MESKAFVSIFLMVSLCGTIFVSQGVAQIQKPPTVPGLFPPGLYKIFDEILVNAADNKRRDPSMDSVKVVIDVEKNQISVCYSGDGLPLEEGVYVPRIFFGDWLSRNYNNNVKKTTGGRNVFGATLTNIFSTEFIIEIADGKISGKKYKQVFGNNMGKKYDPVITECNKSENWTKGYIHA